MMHNFKNAIDLEKYDPFVFLLQHILHPSLLLLQEFYRIMCIQMQRLFVSIFLVLVKFDDQ